MTASPQFRSRGILEHLGVRIVNVDGDAVVELDMRADLENSAGMLQGGILATLIDVAAGVAAARAVGRRQVFTADMNIHYLRPGRVGPFRATGTVLRAGRTAIVTEVTVVDTGADDRVMTVARATFTVPTRGPADA